MFLHSSVKKHLFAVCGKVSNPTSLLQFAVAGIAVNDVAQRFSQEIATQVFCGNPDNPLKGFWQGPSAGNMRGDDGVGNVPKPMVGGQRLRIGNVQRHAAQMPAFQRVAQRFGVDGGASAYVDEHRSRFHFANAFPIEDFGGLAVAG